MAKQGLADLAGWGGSEELAESANKTPVSRRVHERRRDELVREVQEARREFDAGLCRPTTPDDLIAEILS